ncbi:MAG: CDP-alcohol phosphatidyltransferase family protein, partial [Alphaproteobacteria bacterium]|nr:CDP-alcohol phosphatidyltransferase family protein [Alphaproteobacteria bacterium]
MIDFLISKLTKIYKELQASDFLKNLTSFYSGYQKKFDVLGKKLAKQGINANMVSIFGFIIGIMAVNFLAMNMYFEALICILTNRFCDLLDGAVARHEGPTSFGIFLDAGLDFIFYAGVIFGFALADPEENAVSACFLLFSFTASATTMLAYGIVAHKTEKSDFAL